MGNPAGEIVPAVFCLQCHIAYLLCEMMTVLVTDSAPLVEISNTMGFRMQMRYSDMFLRPHILWNR